MASIPKDRRYVPRRDAVPVSGRDEGRMEVDLILDGLERLIYDEYRDAATEMRAKALRYLEEYRAEDYRRREQLKAQGINPKNDDEYVRWRKSHIAQGRRWIEMMDALATDMTHHNQITASAISGHLPEVYACGYNYGIFDGERQSLRVTPFTLYDRRTVEILLRDNPQLVPAPKPEVDIPKDKRWNMQLLSSQIAQGIMQGETIDQIADRLSDRVAIANRNSAVRAARTAVTAAENGGRLQSYRDLESAGIKTTKTWIATLDSRTRDTHRDLDGETIGTDKTFSNGCRYPGDPLGDPAEVYNCRCTLISQVVKIDIMKGTRADGTIDGKTYEEWKQGKREQAEREASVQEAREERRTPEYEFAMPVAGAAEVNQHLAAMPANEQIAWERNFAAVQIEIDDSARIEHYDPHRDVTILFTTSSADSVFHEVSHNIAHRGAVSTTMQTESRQLRMGQWREYHGEPYEIGGVLSAIQAVYDAKSEDGYGQSQYAADMEGIWRWAGVPHDGAEPTVPDAECYQRVYQALNRFEKEHGEQAVGVLSDMIDAVTLGKWPMIHGNHGAEYWQSDASLRWDEAWAEISALRATQNQSAVDAIGEVMPAITDAVNTVWGVVYEGRTFEHVTMSETDRRVQKDILRISPASV